MNVLGLEEFNVLEGYESEQWYKFVIEAKESPFFCTLCGTSAGIGEDGEPLPSQFKLHDKTKRTVFELFKINNKGEIKWLIELKR